MAKDDARQKILDLIDKKAFDPVLQANLDDYSAGDRKKLKDAQGTTKSTKKRYHDDYGSAEEVYKRYKDDLSSDAAADVDAELRALKLPTLASIKGEVEQLAKQEGLKG